MSRHNVILSEAKNLGSNQDRAINGNRQRCFASLNMTAPFQRNILLLELRK